MEALVDALASALEWGEQSTRALDLTTQAAPRRWRGLRCRGPTWARAKGRGARRGIAVEAALPLDVPNQT